MPSSNVIDKERSKGGNWIHLHTTPNVVVSWSIQEVSVVVVGLKLYELNYETCFELFLHQPVWFEQY